MRGRLLVALFTLGFGALACSSESNASRAGEDVTDSGVSDGESPGGRDAQTSDTPDTESSDSDATAADGEATDASDDVGADSAVVEDDEPPICNALAVSGAAVTLTRIASAPPTLTGGTIVDGTYVLTQAVEYTGVGGSTLPGEAARATIRLEAGSHQGIFLAASDAHARSTSGTFATSGSSWTMTETCPESDTAIFGYEATATTLRLLQTFDDVHVEMVLSRQ